MVKRRSKYHLLNHKLILEEKQELIALMILLNISERVLASHQTHYILLCMQCVCPYLWVTVTQGAWDSTIVHWQLNLMRLNCAISDHTPALTKLGADADSYQYDLVYRMLIDIIIVTCLIKPGLSVSTLPWI